IGHAQSLDLEAACAAGLELVDLAGQISSRRMCLRVAEVLRALEQFEGAPQVVELREAARPVLEQCAN
ncbi:hypothetical protein ACFQ07_32055, partial [Actinomadura adrarensis]